MITLKYEKRFPLSMISHIDMLRVMNRVFSRAKLETEYSAGYNPHALIFFSPALSLGAESVCEYVTVAAKDEEKGIIERLNAVSPKGMVFVDAIKQPKNPNLAAVVTSALYEIRYSAIEETNVELLSKQIKEGYEITYLEKGEPCTKNVSDMVFGVEKKGNALLCTLACGNKNLKADRFIKGVLENMQLPCEELSITKLDMFTADGMSIEKFLKLKAVFD